VPGKVTAHGPRLDGEGNPIPYTLDLLVVSLDKSPLQMTWEPENHTEGISQLVHLGSAVS